VRLVARVTGAQIDVGTLRRLRALCDDRHVVTRRGPSLAKTRTPPLVERRGEMVRTTEGRWRELFDGADMMSEGAAKDEPGGERTWYGSTSLILELPVETSLEIRAELLAIARKDVHAHVHALRSAHREAQSRAPGLLGRVACELRFSDDPRGLRIDVDVQAPLIERRRVTRTLG
jgi:hypothetical protein